MNRYRTLILLIILTAAAALSAASNCVRLGESNLFCLRGENRERASNRAELATAAVEDIMADPELPADSVIARRDNGKVYVVFRDTRIISVLPEDTLGTGKTREELAESWAERISRGIREERSRSLSLGNLGKLALGILFPFILIIAYVLIHKVYKSCSRGVVKREGTSFRGISIRGVEFLPARLQISIILKLFMFIKWALLAVVFYALMLLFFNLFPATTTIAETILQASLESLKSLGAILVDVAKFLLAAFVFYIIARILWALADLIFRHYRDTQGEEGGRIPVSVFVPLKRFVKAIIVFLFIVAVVAVIPEGGEYVSLGMLLVAMVFMGIALIPFILSAFAGISIMFTGQFREGDRIRVNSTDGVVVSVGVVWTRINVGGDEIVVMNRYFLDSPFAVSGPEEKSPEAPDSDTKEVNSGE